MPRRKVPPRFTHISVHPNFSVCVGSHLPSCGGPLDGREFPDVVGTPPNLIPTSGVHIPAGGGAAALVGVGAVSGASACASAPYCGFCASTCFCCCSAVVVACCRPSELIRVARSLCDRLVDVQIYKSILLTFPDEKLLTCARMRSCVHRLGTCSRSWQDRCRTYDQHRDSR